MIESGSKMPRQFLNHRSIISSTFDAKDYHYAVAHFAYMYRKFSIIQSLITYSLNEKKAARH